MEVLLLFWVLDLLKTESGEKIDSHNAIFQYKVGPFNEVNFIDWDFYIHPPHHLQLVALRNIALNLWIVMSGFHVLQRFRKI